MENLPACLPTVSLMPEFQGFLCFLYRLKVLGLKLSWSLHGHVTKRDNCGQGRDGGSLGPAAVSTLLCSGFLHLEESREGLVLLQTSGGCLSFLPGESTGREGSLHRLFASGSLAIAVTCSEREERFWFSLCKIDRKLSMLWEAVLHLSCAGPFCTNYPWTRSTLAKNSSKRNCEFPELWSYQFCIIWLTIPLKVFIFPLVKLKSAHSLVQELTSLWCYILCNGVRPGKVFTAKPRSELNLQCLKPCLNLIPLLPSAFVNTRISKTCVIPWKYPPVTQQHVAEDESRVSLMFSLLFPWPHFFYNVCESKSDCFTKLS